MNSSAIVGIGLAMMLLADARAVSMSGRETDDSVCDLGPDTAYRVSTMVFVPAYTDRLPEIYGRLAMRFITQRCKQSQYLILHSRTGRRIDDEMFRLVSTKLCTVPSIERSSTATQDQPHSFQLKCRITKFREARSAFEAEERRLPVEELIAQNNVTPPEISGNSEGSKKEEPCDAKLTAGQVLFGFGGRCASRAR